jgi:hypothetical protein
VGVGQPQVQQHEICRRGRQGGRGRLHEGHVEALTAELGGQWLADGIVIFDHENLHCSGSFPQAVGIV